MMYKKEQTLLHVLLALVVISFIVFEIVPTFAQTTITTFSRNLTIGSRGADVLELQKFLNVSPETRLASSGPGSPGEETTYFGPITRAAVVRYQDLYAATVLFPLGLSRGTGFFGPSTRKHIHENQTVTTQAPNTSTLQQKNTPPDVASSDVLSLGSEAQSGPPTLFFPDRYDGIVGTTVTFQGLNLSGKDVVIHFGNTTINDTISADGSTITFQVPHVPPGRYFVSVSNSKGISGVQNFFVRSLSAKKPSITGIEPKEIIGETKVTITGTGFSQKGNTIYTGYSIIEDMPSTNGTTLSFFLLPPNEAGDISSIVIDTSNFAKESDDIADLITDIGETFDIYIVNEGGISNPISYTYFYDKDSFK